MTSEHQETWVAAATRRRVGVVALRRLRRMVDLENDQDQHHGKWALRIGVSFALAIVLFIAWLFHRAG